MLIQLKGVKKYFPVKRDIGVQGPRTVRAVDRVDLAIRAGEHLGLVGESGSGKTTLGRVILKLYPVDEGRIVFEGRDITRLSARQVRPLRRHFQMVFQDPYSSLDPRYPVRRILQEADILCHHRDGRASRERRMTDVLASVGLPADSLDRFPHEFSGGERQRVAIARALIMGPKLLILDEAVSSLDVLIQEQIMGLLRDLQNKYAVTYLFITHNLRIVRKLCQRIAVMYQGKIVEVADTDEIFQSPRHPYTQELLSAAVHYKAAPRQSSIVLREDSCLIDLGNGHFVIN